MLPGATRKQRDAAAALNVLLQADRKDPKLLAKIRATFTRLDLDGNGSLDSEELQILYSCVELPPSCPSVEQLVEKFDENNDGKIQFAEFEHLMVWVIRHRK